MKKIQEKRIFITYEIALLLKAVQAFLEILSGLLLYVVSTEAIRRAILFVANGELSEFPNDSLSNFLIQSAHYLSSSGKLFIISYLLLHGVVKLAIIVGLFFKKPWAYPAALIGFGGLILYQIEHIVFFSRSAFLLVITFIDIVILLLIVREHQKSIVH